MDSRDEKKKKRKKDGDDQKKVKRKRALIALEKDSSTALKDGKKSVGTEGMKAAEDDIREMPSATAATKVKRKKGKEKAEKGYNQTAKGSSKIAGNVEGKEKESGIPLKASARSLSMEARNATENNIIEMPSATITINKKRKKSKEKGEKGYNQTTKGSSNSALNVEDKITGKPVLAAEAKGKKEVSSMMKGKRTDDYDVSHPKKIIKSSKDDSDTSALKKKEKKVTFSNEIEVFYFESESGNDENAEGPLVQGKQFTIEEDNQVMKAIGDYIQKHQLGEEGIHMILNFRKYPQLRNCWKEIGACVPYQPHMDIYYRANCLLERGEKHVWEPKESEMVQRFHATHGAGCKTLAGQHKKHKIHLKDCWRRIKFTDIKRGPRSQDEYQNLFDLVNMDLQLKASKKMNSKHGMIRNVSWTAIGEKLTSQNSSGCCIKWYKQLTSPLVNEGLWEDVDDYQLLAALQNVDACCVEDVDWDNLLEHRSGEVCRNRWGQMTRHIGGFKEKPFIEQVEVLSKRYSSDMMIE